MYGKIQRASYQLYEELGEDNITVINDPIAIKSIEDLNRLQKSR